MRLVYFNTANTMLDTEVQTRLGMQENADEPSVGAPRVKLTGTYKYTCEECETASGYNEQCLACHYTRTTFWRQWRMIGYTVLPPQRYRCEARDM